MQKHVPKNVSAIATLINLMKIASYIIEAMKQEILHLSFSFRTLIYDVTFSREVGGFC
jgi:hypothetical protein